MYDEIYETFLEVSKDNINRDLFNNSTESVESLIEDIKQNKIVVYTAFTGDYDTLKEPEFIDDNCDYVCFTDNPNLTSDIWDIRLMEESTLDNNRIAKQYKVLPHKYLPEYKYSFWLDGTFKIKGSLREYVYKNIKADSEMLCVVHTERDCIYDEYKASKIIPRYPRVIMKEQIDTYKSEGFPKHYGMGVMGSIFRKHNDPIIIELMESWWDEIIKFTNQDQLSFAYVCWKHDFHPSVSLIYYWDNEYWSKDENEYHHKVVIATPMTSQNLLDKIIPIVEDMKLGDTLELSKEELYLLVNDVKGLTGYRYDTAGRNAFLMDEIDKLKSSNSMKITTPLRLAGKYGRVIKDSSNIREAKSLYSKIKALDLFDFDGYRQVHPGIVYNPLYHFINIGSKKDSIDKKSKYINPIFDLEYYINSNNLEEGIDPVIHFIKEGFSKGYQINGNGLFITNFNEPAGKQYEDYLDDFIIKELNENNYITTPDILLPYLFSQKPFKTNTIKVGVFLEDSFENMNACPYIRIHSIFEKLSQSGDYHFFMYGKDIMDSIEEDDIIKSKIFDVVVLQRSNFHAVKILKQAKRHDIKVIYETDDNLFDLQPDNPSYDIYTLYKEQISKIINEVDMISVSTPSLAEKVKKLGYDNITIIKNYYLKDILPFKPVSNNKNSDIIKIGYFGTITHDADLEMIHDAILKVKANYPIELEVLGAVSNEAEWYKTLPLPYYPMPLELFMEWLSNNADWDIGIVPLCPSEFNNDKSELKFIEFTALGVPVIASSTKSYVEAIDDGVSGFLANNEDEWVNKLENLINNSDLRYTMLNNAREIVLKDYNIDSRIKQWDLIFKNLI